MSVKLILIEIVKMTTAQTFLAQGLSLANQSKWQQAINCWQQAITIEPNFVEAHFNMGIALHKTKKSIGR